MILVPKQSSIRYIQTFFVLLTFFLTTLPVAADDYKGRYQAVVLHEGGQGNQFGKSLPEVFIIDSQDGHMWTLEQHTKLEGVKGGFALGTVLTYQGRVRPGKKMGEIIEQAEGQ